LAIFFKGIHHRELVKAIFIILLSTMLIITLITYFSGFILEFEGGAVAFT